MSIKFTYLFQWLSIRWPYAIATVLALSFVISKGFPVLKRWFDRRTQKLTKIGLEINKLQVEPQLVTDADDIDMYDPERKRLLQKTAQQLVGTENGRGWPFVIGILSISAGLAMLVLWFLKH
jgi:hypothetical protein